MAYGNGCSDKFLTSDKLRAGLQSGTKAFSSDSRGSRRSKGPKRSLITQSLLGFGKKVEYVPAPSKQLSKQDRARIKQDGPSINDLLITATQKYTEQGTNKSVVEPLYCWIPPSVLGSGVYVQEPKWKKIPKMNFLELYTGIQRRNWTSQYYDPDAVPWKLSVYKDSMRRWLLPYQGYRVVVTEPDGSQRWAAVPRSGSTTFTEDHMSAGSQGGQWRAKRTPKTPADLGDIGYNQLFEEIFQAYQQRLPEEAEQQYLEDQWVDQDRIPYDCPGEEKLQVSFRQLPVTQNVGAWILRTIPSFAIFIGSLAFVFVCLWLSIFRPRKAMPTDAYMAIEFAQSKGQARQEGKTGVKFGDVAGMDQTLLELQEIVEFLKNPKRFLALGTRPPKGVLLEGPPGCGKTLCAKAIAGEAGVPFYQMAGSDFVEAIVGVGAARVRDLFKRARAQESPCIIFVDEIDAMGTIRAQAGEETNEEREQTLNQLLTEMDGFTPDLGVVFIGATNRTDLLDPALLRAGRFDKKYVISKPDTQGRYDVLKVHFRKRPTEPDVNLMQIARDLPGLTGAELANVANEGALECGRRGGRLISRTDVYNGIDRILQGRDEGNQMAENMGILQGISQPGLPERMQVRRWLTVYEAGRAVVATALRRRCLQAGARPHVEAVERVTILPRGGEWTRTIFMRGDDEDYTMATKQRLQDRLQVILGGRAAEEVALPEGPSSYSGGALIEATALANKMVANYGLSPLGITIYAPATSATKRPGRQYEVSVEGIDEDLFGRAAPGGSYQPNEQYIGRIRMAAQELVWAAYEADCDILREWKAAHAAIVDCLLEDETISGAKIEQLMDAHPPDPQLIDVSDWTEPLEMRAFQKRSASPAYVRENTPAVEARLD